MKASRALQTAGITTTQEMLGEFLTDFCQTLHLRSIAVHRVYQIEEDTDRDRFMGPEESRQYGLIDNVVNRAPMIPVNPVRIRRPGDGDGDRVTGNEGSAQGLVKINRHRGFWASKRRTDNLKVHENMNRHRSVHCATMRRESHSAFRAIAFSLQALRIPRGFGRLQDVTREDFVCFPTPCPITYS